jgi:hypothetical protein
MNDSKQELASRLLKIHQRLATIMKRLEAVSQATQLELDTQTKVNEVAANIRIMLSLDAETRELFCQAGNSMVSALMASTSEKSSVHLS